MTRSRDDYYTTLFGQATQDVNYAVNSRNDYTTIGLKSPDWTANGELEDSDLGQTLVWNWRGELVSVSQSGSTHTFEHDALGRRITTDFGTEVRYTWAGERIVEEISSASSPTVYATWAWGADAEPVRMETSSTVSFYHADAEGSVEKLTGSTGTVLESVEYTAWGQPAVTSSESAGNPFLWRGGFYDVGLGLYESSRGPYDPLVMLRPLAASGSRLLGPASLGSCFDHPDQHDGAHRLVGPELGRLGAPRSGPDIFVMSNMGFGVKGAATASAGGAAAGLWGLAAILWSDTGGCMIGCRGASDYWECVRQCSHLNK